MNPCKFERLRSGPVFRAIIDTNTNVEPLLFDDFPGRTEEDYFARSRGPDPVPPRHGKPIALDGDECR